MSFSNNGTKVRNFGEITKFLSDFFLLKIELFLVRVTHLPTYPLMTGIILSFVDNKI